MVAMTTPRRQGRWRWVAHAAVLVLSEVYLLFFAFVPLALTLALVCSTKLESGLFFATALSLKSGVGYRAVDVTLVRSAMRDNGSLL